MSNKADDTNRLQLERHNRELAILKTIAESLNREVDLAQALHAALTQIAEIFGLHTAWIWLLNEQSGEPYLAVAENLPPALATVPERMDGSEYCYCLDTYQSGDLRGAANVNVVTCTRLQGLVDGTDGLRHHASIPLNARGKRLGLLNLASTDWRKLSADDLRTLHTVGDMLSIAIERARLFRQSAELGAAEERNRLAREIHDTLAQGLAGIALQLESADALLDTGGMDRAQQAIRQALALTRRNLDEARRSVLDLRAAPLVGQTLADALRKLAEDHAVRGSLSLDFHSGESRPLSVRIENALYRIVQEALTNVLKHASARRLTVRLSMTAARVDLVIADDGCGFDPAHTPTDRYGLLGVSERVRLLHGAFRLYSNPGEGTRLEISVPTGSEA